MHTVVPFESSLTAELIDQPTRVARLASGWGALYAHSSARTPFQSHEWLLPWIDVFCPASLRVVAVCHQDRLIGLAPLLIYPRESERVLAFAGGGVSDYLDVLAEPGNEPAIIEAIFSAVLEDQSWTTLELTDLAPHSILLQSAQLRQLALRHDTSSVLSLPTNHIELIGTFSKRQRANLRNARSRLQRTGGGLIECATAETVPEFLDDLFRLHTMRWSERGEPGVLKEERLRAFHSLATRCLLARGILRIFRLRLEAGTAAVIYAFFDRDTVYCYLQGFDPGFAFLSPGTLLMFSVIEAAVGWGMRSFDFLRGQEAYKQHWRPQDRSTYRITLGRRDVARLSSSKP